MSITEYDTYKHTNSSKTEEPYIETASYSATQPAGFASNTTIDNGVFATVDALVDERDTVAVQKILSSQEDLRHSFSVKKHFENGDVENYLWTVRINATEKMGYLACYQVLGDKYSKLPIHSERRPFEGHRGEKRVIEFEPEEESFEHGLSAIDRTWAEALGRMTITHELYEGELDKHTYSIGTGTNEANLLQELHDAEVIYLRDVDYLSLEELFAEDAA